MFSEADRPGVLDGFLAAAAEDANSEQRRRLDELRVPRGGHDEERDRAAELLTHVRDWTATALERAGTSLPMLPPGSIRTGDDAFGLLQVLEPVEEELDSGAVEPALQRVVESAVAAARNGLRLGPPPGRAPGARAAVVEDVSSADEDLVAIGRSAGSTLGAWGHAGLGDPVHEAAEAIRAAAGPVH